MLEAVYIDDGRIECGVDEAGRGCLAGGVYAAAVILPHGYSHPLLNDSKQLSQQQRLSLRADIEHDATAWGLGVASVQEIDQLNILRASFLAMHRAIEALSFRPDRLLIDGNRFSPYDGLEHHCVIKGDGRLQSIAAASILAKTYRDEAMEALGHRYPGYGFERHKGYPTSQHRSAIASLGPCPEHRRSFRLLAEPTLFD